MNKKIIILAFCAATVGFSGCKKILDTNTNPNVAQNATPDALLPTAELNMASAMGVDFQINGSIWAEYWTQSSVASQYKTLEQYQPTATRYDNPWEQFYVSTLKTLSVIESKTQSADFSQYNAVAKLLKAYCYQNITDAWGDVPYTQALKGAPEEGGITSPAYDPQQLIYDGILNTIDSAITLIDFNNTNTPSTGDLIYGGDMDKWLRFAYTLKLKVYLRMSEVNPTKAANGIAAIYADPNAEFIVTGGDALINYSKTPGAQNPLYSEEVGLSRTQNIVASATVVDSMNNNNDLRVFQFFDPIGAGVAGLPQGGYNLQVSASTPSALVGANANDDNSGMAPVKFITSYESDFLQAEAIARGWASGDAQALFEQGINDNYAAYGLEATDAQDYIANSYWGQYPVGGSVQQQVRHIVTQKWFSMCGNQGFEAWTEQRRTGYPDFFVVSANSLLGGNSLPERFLYPNVELTRNAKFPGQKQITDKVWWDVN